MAGNIPRGVEEDERPRRGHAAIERPGVGIGERGGEAIVPDTGIVCHVADELLAPERPRPSTRLAIGAQIPLAMLTMAELTPDDERAVGETLCDPETLTPGLSSVTLMGMTTGGGST